MADQHCGRMRWQPMDKFGAEVSFDLNDKMSVGEAECFVQLFNEHGLLVFRKQNLSLERQIKVVELLGPVMDVPDTHHVLSNQRTDEISQTIELKFHSDFAWAPHPLVAISMHAIDVVDGASSTRYANARLAYERLPDSIKTRLHDLDVEMVAPDEWKQDKTAIELDASVFPMRERRPAVRVHDRTGKPFLLLSEAQAFRVFGMEQGESKAFLESLFGKMYAAGNVYEHVWHGGDFVLWDNKALQHARSNVSNVGKRVIQRAAVGVGLAEQYPGVMRAADYSKPKAAAQSLN